MILLTGISCVLSACIKEGTQPEEYRSLVAVGDAIPSFTVSDGVNTFSSDNFTGKKSLLVFFHTSCGDCREALPKIEEAWEMLKSEPDVQVIAIARGEELEDVRKFWNGGVDKDIILTIPFYLDPDKSVYARFATGIIPRVYAIDPQGKITWMAIETINESVEEIVNLVKNQ